MGKTIHTVKGLLSQEMLGKTMTHEHLLWVQPYALKDDPEELSYREFIHQKVCMENLGQIYYNAHLNLDNIKQYNTDLAIEEVMYYKKAGGNSIVDVTSIGIGRDPKALLAVSEVTGLNIIMGSGYYIETSHPKEIKSMDKAEIADKLIKEFADGVKDTGIKPGVIGEIGVIDLSNTEEIKVLKAASIAQKETGAPLYIHPPLKPVANEILDIVEKEGADLSKVVICHCDPTINELNYHDSIAKRGAFVEYDQFGLEFPVGGEFILPRDIDRIKAIKTQIDKGNISNIIISQDVCFKTCLVKYGGWGYGHILRDLVPFMKKQELSDKELDIILVDNPRKLLAY